MSSFTAVIQHHKSYWLQSQRELDIVQSFSGYLHWQIFQCTRLLALGDHQALRTRANKIIGSKHKRLGCYYLAKSYFLCADYERAVEYLKDFLALQPYHADANYLLSQIYQAQGLNAKAWLSLLGLAAKSKRLKTWMFLAQLVNTPEQLNEMREHLALAQKKELIPKQHSHLNQYVAHAALRAEQYPVAFRLWHESYLRALNSPSISKKQKHQQYSVERASIALKDLKISLSLVDIPFFLVSGTLLGCIREGALLGHDKDIDVGIWEAVPLDSLLQALRASGLFYVQPQRSPWLVKVKHVNGIPIDIFYHLKEGSNYWHGGIKSRWYNSDFDLKEHDFLGGRYLIPVDSDLYLTENYGDWRTPKPRFDNVYDTPNSKVTNENELVVHNYRALIKATQSNDTEQAVVWRDRLRQLEHVWSFPY